MSYFRLNSITFFNCCSLKGEERSDARDTKKEKKKVGSDTNGNRSPFVF